MKQRKKPVDGKRERPTDLKHRLYESCVQSSAWQSRYLPKFHARFTGGVARAIREDFCGTARISCDWAKRSKANRAVGIDLDSDTLEYARRVNVQALTPSARSRVELLHQDVRKPTREKFDVIGAHNFSFFIFHERAELLAYAKAARASLKARGTFFLEMAGGDGFASPESNSQSINVPGVGRVRYVWEQHSGDPVSKICDYAIHFRLPSGRWINDAFTYRWRLWEIREVREILLEAGFRDTKVIWAMDESQTEYREVESAEMCEVWLAYVVGIR